MSTRSIIIITGNANHGQKGTTRLYKHSDGYPTGNLPIIAEALERSLQQANVQAKRFNQREADKIIVDQVVGNLIGAATDVYGMGARIDKDYERQDKVERTRPAIYSDALMPAHFGNQGDLEWIYVIDIDASEVRILDGKCVGEAAQNHKDMLADPFAYAKRLKTEFQEGERRETESVLQKIKKLGFAVVMKETK